jgi:hypothetical protein
MNDASNLRPDSRKDSKLSKRAAAGYRRKLKGLKSMRGVFRFRTHEEADLWMAEWKRRRRETEPSSES